MEGNRNDRRFLTEFIELYRSFPCLWKIKSLEYNDRDAKRKAYVVLVKKLRQRIPNATRETVVRKINTLRTTYRREWRKVIRSSSVAASDGQQPQHIHVPQLWYFDMMHFIRNDDDDEDGDEVQEYEDDNANVTAEQMQLIGAGGGGGQATTMDSTGEFGNTPQVGCLTKFEECTESELQPISHDPASSSSTSFPQIVLPHITSFSSPPQSLPPPQSSSSQFGKPSPLSTTSNKRKLISDDNQQQSFDENFKRLRELIEIRLPPPARTNYLEEASDQFSQMAEIWATKLRLLPRERALFAEKKINDILFEACLGNLQQQQQQQQQHHIVSDNNFPVITTSLSSTSSLNYGNNSNSNNNNNNSTTSSQTHCNGFQ